jgi:hypothetical protein
MLPLIPRFLDRAFGPSIEVSLEKPRFSGTLAILKNSLKTERTVSKNGR